MSRYLIINADDFGCSTRQNAAIKELLSKGLVTSSSVMTVAGEFSGAATWLRENCFTAGVHLTINSDSREEPWKSITGDSSLGPDGTLYFRSSDITVHGRRPAVRAELEAQYCVLTAAGVRVDHADSHCGTLYGINLRRFYNDAYDFCASHSLPYRFPESPAFIERQLGRKIPAAVKGLHKMLVEKGRNRGVKLIGDLVTNPLSAERIGTYENLRKWYIDAVDNCGEGVTEIFMHPSSPSADGDFKKSKREFEYELLKSGDLLQRAEDKKIEVISWSDFARM